MEDWVNVDHESAHVVAEPEMIAYDVIVETLRELATPIFVKTQAEEIAKSISRHKNVETCLAKKSQKKAKDKEKLYVLHDCPVCQGEGFLTIYSWKKVSLQNEGSRRGRKVKYYRLLFECNQCGHIDANDEVGKRDFPNSKQQRRVSPIVICSCPVCMEKKQKAYDKLKTLVGVFYKNLESEVLDALNSVAGNWVGITFNHDTWDERVLSRGIYYREESLIEKYNHMFQSSNPTDHQSIQAEISDISFAREKRGEFYCDGSDWELQDISHYSTLSEQELKSHRAYRLKQYTVDALIAEAMIVAKICDLKKDKKTSLLNNYLSKFMDEDVVNKKINMNRYPTPGASEKIIALIHEKTFEDFLEKLTLDIPVDASDFRVFSIGKREYLKMSSKLPSLEIKFPIKFSLGPNYRISTFDIPKECDLDSWQKLRKRLGLRLVDIAGKMEIEVEEVLMIETGEKMPTTQQLGQYLDLVHSCLDDL